MRLGAKLKLEGITRTAVEAAKWRLRAGHDLGLDDIRSVKALLISWEVQAVWKMGQQSVQGDMRELTAYGEEYNLSEL